MDASGELFDVAIVKVLTMARSIPGDESASWRNGFQERALDLTTVGEFRVDASTTHWNKQ